MSSSDGNAVYNIIAFVFADRNSALELSKQLKQFAKPEGYKIIANAVVEVDDKGKAHVHEAGHGGWGTGLGLVGGGLLGLIGGPAGLLVWAVAGGAIGGIIGKYTGRAIPADDLKRLAVSMQPNTSAILAMVEDKEAEALIDSMAGYSAQIVTLTVGDEVSGEIAVAVEADVEGPEGDAPAAAAATDAAPAAAPAASTEAATAAAPAAADGAAKQG